VRKLKLKNRYLCNVVLVQKERMHMDAQRKLFLNERKATTAKERSKQGNAEGVSSECAVLHVSWEPPRKSFVGLSVSLRGRFCHARVWKVSVATSRRCCTDQQSITQHTGNVELLQYSNSCFTAMKFERQGGIWRRCSLPLSHKRKTLTEEWRFLHQDFFDEIAVHEIRNWMYAFISHLSQSSQSPKLFAKAPAQRTLLTPHLLLLPLSTVNQISSVTYSSSSRIPTDSSCVTGGLCRWLLYFATWSVLEVISPLCSTQLDTR